MRRVWLCGLIIYALGTAVLAQEGSGDKDLKIDGKLTKDDPKDARMKSYSKTHTVKFKAAGVYLIDMVSKELDAYLFLEDDNGKLVADDDDGGGFPNARIVFECPKDGDYKVICTAFPEGKSDTGEYTLTVRKGTMEDLKKAFPHRFMIGQPAADIAGDFSLNGKTTMLSQLKGKVVLLDFWAVWCGPCIATFPHLREWSKEFQKDGLEILGVTTYYEAHEFDKTTGKLSARKAKKDEKDQAPTKPTAQEEQSMVKDFAEYHKLTHQLMMVSRGNWAQAGKDYHVQGIPTAVLVDRQGVIRMIQVGSGEDNAKALQAEIKKLIAEK